MKPWALLLLALPVGAVDLAGVKLPDQWTQDGHTLVLNGAGVREYGFFGFDVYAAGLYLPSRQRQVQAVLDAPGPKLLVLHLFHGATPEDTIKAWQPYFAGNCAAPCQLPRAQIEAFNALIPPTQKGDVQSYWFENDTVTIVHNGRMLGRVEGGGFARVLLSTWIGAVPTTQDLKRALLGGPPPSTPEPSP